MRNYDRFGVDYKLLGVRIREARERKGLSQEEFAALISRDQGAVSEYENGKRKLSAIDLLTFAKILDVPLLYFYEGELGTEDLDHALIREFHRLPTPEAKQAIIEIVRIMSDTINPHSS